MNGSRSPENIVYFEEWEKNRGGQHLMSCSWIRKLTVQDRKMTTKEVSKKERSLFCYCNKKIRMEPFRDSILPIFSFDANVQQESEETVMSKYWCISTIPCMFLL